LHYQHRYHAGNFADVFKHTLLCGLLSALNRKEAPWFFLDTHAGAGLYDLKDVAAGRTAEQENGIARLRQTENAPAMVQGYLRLVQAQDTERPGHYPGSPMLARALARAGDRIALCEQVPAVAEQLRIAMGRDTRVAIHLRDGYEGEALLPPVQKRGLIFVDPPFERRDEFDAMSEFLKRSLARFAHGIYALWYPIKNQHEAKRFLRRASLLERPVLSLSLETGAEAEGQMRAVGMVVVNPPFGFEEQARDALQFLARRLAQGQRPVWSVETLRPDK